MVLVVMLLWLAAHARSRGSSYSRRSVFHDDGDSGVTVNSIARKYYGDELQIA